MIVHIVKLCVGCDSVEDLADWQRNQLAAGQDLVHVTRQTPRREGVGPQSSLYWVIGGFIRARQHIVGLREVRGADGILRCGIELDPILVPTEPQSSASVSGVALFAGKRCSKGSRSEWLQTGRRNASRHARSARRASPDLKRRAIGTGCDAIRKTSSSRNGACVVSGIVKGASIRNGHGKRARRAPSPSRTELCAGQTVNGSLPGGGAPWVLIALWLTKARRNHFRPMSGPKLVDPARSGRAPHLWSVRGRCYKPLKYKDVLLLINCPLNRT